MKNARCYSPYEVLRVEVTEAWKEGQDTRGKGCSYYEVGDVFFIEQIALRKENIQTRSGMLCMAALADHIPFYRALLRGITPVELGIAKSDDPSSGYLRCHDPTGKRCLPMKSATIIFKITPLP
jgi:uncharacterized repeat protein (TIGR04076 family)